MYSVGPIELDNTVAIRGKKMRSMEIELQDRQGSMSYCMFGYWIEQTLM